MAWIESHTVLIRHRKVSDLARLLRLRKSYVIGHLHALWHAALEQQEDGDLTGWSDEFIAEQSDFPGDAPQYVRLLQEVGFLDGRIIHDWIDYAGLFLIKRYLTGNRARLIEIWAKHGKIYGKKKMDCAKRVVSEQKVSNERVVSEQKVSLPNQPDLTNQPNQPNQHTRGSPDVPAGFVKFWNSWPVHRRKVNRAACEKRWINLKLEPMSESILSTLEGFKASEDWCKDAGQYIPAPLTWINQERWKVPLETLQSRSVPGHTRSATIAGNREDF